jgi:dolichol kinase
MSRTSAPSGLLYGPLQLNLLLIYLGVFEFMEEEAAILLAAVGIGDGISPLIGKRHGRHVYHVPFSNKKTMEGSLVGVFLGTVAGCYLFPYVLGIPVRPLRVVLALSGIAAVVEGTSPGNMDNIMIPLVLHFSIERVDHLLADLA